MKNRRKKIKLKKSQLHDQRIKMNKHKVRYVKVFKKNSKSYDNYLAKIQLAKIHQIAKTLENVEAKR